MGSTQRQREVNPRNRNRDRGRGRGREWCPGVAAGGAGVLPQKRCDWTGRRRKLADCGRPHASRGVALLDRGGPLRVRGRWWWGRDGRCGSIYVYPAVRRGVGLRDEAARQAEAVSDGGEGVRGRSGRAGAGLVASSGGIGAVGGRRGYGKACIGGGGRRGDEGGMRVGGIGTVPVPQAAYRGVHLHRL